MKVRILILLVSVTFVSGCIGVAAIGTQKENYGPDVALIGEQRKDLMKSARPQSIIKEDVLRKWGEPHKRLKEGQLERWVYNDEELSWNGVILGLILPIPLMVPTGHYYTSLTFSGNKLVDSWRVTKQSAGLLCALSPEGLKPSCGAWSKQTP